MSLSQGLMQHSIRLLGNPSPQPPHDAQAVDLRRAVSAAYYAVFHHLCEAAVEQIAPQASSKVANTIHRWFDHREMKKICSEFAGSHLKPPLRGLLGDKPSVAMQTLAISFITLQEARHSADYDLEYQLSWEQARQYVETAGMAIGAWNHVAPTAETNIFILSLLLWKNWERDRQST